MPLQNTFIAVKSGQCILEKQVEETGIGNFKHIVRYDKIQQFNAVNIENGYRAVAIYSPREVT